jgi:hypothetical protein
MKYSFRQHWTSSVCAPGVPWRHFSLTAAAPYSAGVVRGHFSSAAAAPPRQQSPYSAGVVRGGGGGLAS